MKKKILIIDDDEEMCEELMDILKDEGYVVKAVFNGNVGKKQLDEEKFDILLLDIKIPGLNGFEILHELKQQATTITIIVLTGRPVNETITQFENKLNEEELLQYAHFVINKPFKVEELINKIESL